MNIEVNKDAKTWSHTESSLSEYVYQQVKQKIIYLQYEPEQFLTETMLSSEYQVSKMPVKLAMRKLKKEGWLSADFRRKTRVKGITEKDIRSIYDFRFLIENHALDLIFQKQLVSVYADRLEENLMQAQAKSDSIKSYLLAERTMHAALNSVYENERISDVYSNLQDEIIRISCQALISQSIDGNLAYADVAFKSWQFLIEHLRARNYILAKRELLDHLQLGQRNSLQALEKWQQTKLISKTEKTRSINNERGIDIF
jgi:DNA-binding GntR family transcriptional regulator